ncbi:ATP-binding protein [Wolinella succinogenes]|uniref:ATP-binding protein n=1 Tax=Wolinella succinogenes TaxID=844 RepID=UPI002409616B|nr:DUF87 domain-containing protein [Wolinella succinogenes]
MAIIADQILGKSELIDLLGDYNTNHIGYVYAMNFTEASVLTNDAWKEKVAGIPHNSFLVAASFDPNKMSEVHRFDKEVILLRVLGPSSLPSDAELLKARIEHNQRRTSDEVFTNDSFDGLDPLTHGELQYGALRCRILGTFYEDQNELRLGSDLENYMSSTRLRVFKPRGDALSKIINHINPEVKNKALDEAKKSGFKGLPTPIEIGTVRYTSTARLHRGVGEPLVPVMIQPSDFLGRRTAVLGMTRTGKSNTVKSTVAAVAMSAIEDNINVGQIIFDVNGEYANANHQDDNSSIADVFGNQCIRYRAVDTDGFEDLRTNFYEECAIGLGLLVSLSQSDPYIGSSTDLKNFMESSLEEPEDRFSSEHKRWAVAKAIFQCILYRATFESPKDFKVYFEANKDIKALIDSSLEPKNGLTLEQACDWFLKARDCKEQLKSSSGKPWIDDTMSSYLNMLAKKSSGGQNIRGYSALNQYKTYHSAKRKGVVEKEIYQHLLNGKIVILDLSSGPVSIREVLSKRIARYIFDNALATMNGGQVPQNIVIYVEEAHNLIGRKEELTSTWPRIAKEGAKAKIAFVYATQEPSSIHPNILANTENWFVTHLNNEDELRSLGKFYDFADFHDSLKTAQDVGFARIKTLSSPFVVPTQINRFTPEKLKEKISQYKGA